MLTQFRDFVLRGNVIDLAVAVVIGAAFGSVVDAAVADLVTPLIAAIGGQPDFGELSFTVNGSRFRYGDFINAALAFLTVAAVVFLLVVRPMNALMAGVRREEAPALLREAFRPGGVVLGDHDLAPLAAADEHPVQVGLVHGPQSGAFVAAAPSGTLVPVRTFAGSLR